MPPVDPVKKPKRHRGPSQAPRNADTGDATRSRPAPKPQPEQVAPFTRPAIEKPFEQQRTQARQRTQVAQNRTPRPRIAAPPVIENPTPGQVQAAHAQIVASVQRELGNTTGAARQQATQALVDRIHNDPGMARVRESLQHWQAERAKLTRPQTTAQLKPGPPPHKVGVGVAGHNFATVNLTAAGQAGARLGAKVAPGLATGDPYTRFAGKVASDVGSIAKAPFIGAYSLNKAVIEDAMAVLHGQNLGHVATQGQYATLNKGVVQSSVQEARHPIQAFQQHPLLTVLDAAGVESAIGRTAGALARARGIERANVIRPPLALGDDLAAGVVERDRSKDLFRSLVQQHQDAKHEPLLDPEGNPVTVERGGKQVPVLQPRDTIVSAIRHPKVGAQGALNLKRADTIAGRTNANERQDRDVEGKQRQVKGVKGQTAKAAVALVARGAITSADHFQADLTNYLARVRGKLAKHDLEVANGETPTIYLHEGEVEQARRNAQIADKVLRSPRAMAQADRIVAEGIRHGGDLVKHDTAAADAGLFEGGHEQARRARLVETAVEHMGGKHGTDPRLDAQIKAAKAQEQSLQARLNFGHIPPAQRKAVQDQIAQIRENRRAMRASNTKRLRDANGSPLEPDQIEAFLRSRGRDPETVAYLPPSTSNRHFHKQFRPEAGRGTLTTGHIRTGEQARKGAVENSADVLKAAGVRQVTALANARAIDRLVSEHGMSHPASTKGRTGEPLTKHEQRVVDQGGYFTGAEAGEVITRAAAQGKRLVAVRAVPGKLDSETRGMVRDLQGPGSAESLGQNLLNNRFLSEQELKTGQTRNVVLMNQDLVERLQAHLKPSTAAGKFAQAANKAFRYAVLPQLKWVVGNFFEPLVVRMPGVGSGINVFGLAADVVAANRQLKFMDRHPDPEIRAAAEEIRNHQIGGLLFGNRGLTNKRTLEDWPHLDAKAQQAYAQMVAKLPATKQLAQVSGMLLKGSGKVLIAPLKLIMDANRLGEHGIQRAAFGHSVRREAQTFTRNWAKTVKLGDAAMEDVARGLVNTPAQQRFMNAQHELLGQYEGFSPTLRAVIQGPAPFLPWALNAARFVFWTMPGHRSAQTAYLTKVSQVVQKDWDQIHKGTPPGMGLAIPNGKGGWVDLARFTPYGLSGPASGGELQSVTGNFLPQVSGATAAVQGKDPFGRDLVLSTHEKPTFGQKVKIALNSEAEALTPYLSTARRLQEHGETAFADSTVLHPRTKPGTSHGMSAANRVINPFRPTYLSSGGTTEGKPIPPQASQASGPVSPREAFAERRAARIAAQAHHDSQREAFQERRAARLSQHHR